MTTVSPNAVPELATALIGREPEVTFLRKQVTETAAGHGSVVILSGEAGVGKTRLVEAAAAGATAQGFRVLWGRAESEQERVPYGLICGALAWYLDSASPSHQAEVASLVSGLAPHLWPLLFANEELTLGPDPAETPELRQSLFLARLVRLFADLASEQPLLVCLEDLHRADSSSLAVLGRLAQRNREAPLMVLATARPEGGDDGHAALVRQSLQELHRHDHVHLRDVGPLGASDLRALVASCFPREALSAELLDSIHKKSGGVPLYAVQFLEFLIERGVIYQERGLWVGRRLEEGDMPDSVRSAIRRRIESLGPEERELLSLAAAQGDRFEGALVAKALSQPVARTLRQLAELGPRTRLVKSDGRGFRFAHPVLTEIFYQLLPESKRRHIHLRLAYTLERERPDQVEDLAHHLYQAGLYSRALPCLLAAAQRAREAHAYREARLLLIQAQTAREALDGRAPGGSDLEILLNLAEVEERLGDPERSLELSRQAIRQSDDRTDKRFIAEAYMQMGWIHARQSAREEAVRNYRQALDLFFLLGDEPKAAQVYVRLGNVAFEHGALSEAAATYRDAQATATKSGSHALQGSISGNLGVIATVRGDFVEAVLSYTQAIKAYSRIDHRYGLCQTYQNLGMCHAAQQDWGEALTCYGRGEDLARELGTVDVLANILVSMALVHARTAQADEAETSCLRARLLMEQLTNRLGLAECSKVEGIIARERGLHAEARRQLDQARDAFVALENDLGVAECEAELAEVDLLTGDADRAGERLGQAGRLFEELGADAEARRCEARLAEMIT